RDTSATVAGLINGTRLPASATRDAWRRPRMMNSARARKAGLPAYLVLLVAVGIGQKGQVTGALDGGSQLTLIASLGACDTAGDDFSGFGNIALQGFEILVVNLGGAFGGKTTELTATIETLLHDYSSPDSSESSSS